MKADALTAFVRPSLRGRLILSLTLLFLIGSLATWVYQTDVSRRDWYDIGEQTMQSQALALAAAWKRNRSAPLAALSPDWREAYRRPGGDYRYAVYDPSMRLVASSPSLSGLPLPFSEPPPPGQPFGHLAFVGP